MFAGPEQMAHKKIIRNNYALQKHFFKFDKRVFKIDQTRQLKYDKEPIKI